MSHLDADATFKRIAPELADRDQDEIDDFLEIATGRLSPSQFRKPLFTQAVAYLAAHLMTISDRDGNAAGPVVSERAGEVSRSYAQPNMQSVDELRATSYGREFITIRRSSVEIKPLTTAFSTF